MPDTKPVPENEFSLDRLFLWLPVQAQSGGPPRVIINEVMRLFVYDVAMAKFINEQYGVVGVVVLDVTPEISEDAVWTSLAAQMDTTADEIMQQVEVLINPNAHQLTMINVRFAAGVANLEEDVFMALNAELLDYCEARFEDTQHTHIPGNEFPPMPEPVNPNVVSNKSNSKLARPGPGRILKP